MAVGGVHRRVAIGVDAGWEDVGAGAIAAFIPLNFAFAFAGDEFVVADVAGVVEVVAEGTGQMLRSFVVFAFAFAPPFPPIPFPAAFPSALTPTPAILPPPTQP
ncbi:hypothetical protein M422DRAFT_258129 [Sphaerobolus stellatus SS14]|uniref:Uncharacterized protein n=1 Tax=Sphaerobolus stellatus (strain SS14) TaxID=990650 RepID=A0A0C9VNA7_SPHS4|nr:hypothetical protein M422DRAFT_258129 [Sphaerobolus stellatus SS14]